MRKHEWILAIIRVNWSNMVANKWTFYSMMLLMCIQNFLYFSMWMIIFSQMSSLRGWQLNDVAFLYGAGAAGFGLFFTVFGGLNQLGHAIQNGDLDVYLSRPRPTLLMASMQRMRPDSLGDVLTGILMIGLLGKFSLSALPLVVLLTVSTGFVYFAFRLIMHSLAFWNMTGEASERGFGAFVISSTNPQNGFSPFVKGILLTIFPAGYVGLLPVEIVRDFRWDYLALQLGASLSLFAFSIWLFGRGLRRYASGNKFLSLR
jgi:ABC-2 type transport system permease protein